MEEIQHGSVTIHASTTLQTGRNNGMDANRRLRDLRIRSMLAIRTAEGVEGAGSSGSEAVLVLVLSLAPAHASHGF